MLQKVKLTATKFEKTSSSIYLLKFNNRNTRTLCKICSKLTIKTPKRHHWCRSGVFIVNFEYISHVVLVFRLLTLKKQCRMGTVNQQMQRTIFLKVLRINVSHSTVTQILQIQEIQKHLNNRLQAMWCQSRKDQHVIHILPLIFECFIVFASNAKNFAIAILVFFPSLHFFWTDSQRLFSQRLKISYQESV